MAPERPRTVPKGPGSAPEVSGMSRNGPDMSRKVLEASRRSWKVPEGSGQYHPLPCAPSLGGQATYAALAGQWVGGAPRGRNPPPGGNTKTHYGRFPVGRYGKIWEVWESKLDSPPPLIAPQGPLGHLYNVGERWGAQHNQSPRPMRHPPSSKPRCSTFRPRFRRCSRSESVRVFSL